MMYYVYLKIWPIYFTLTIILGVDLLSIHTKKVGTINLIATNRVVTCYNPNDKPKAIDAVETT